MQRVRITPLAWVVPNTGSIRHGNGLTGGVAQSLPADSSLCSRVMPGVGGVQPLSAETNYVLRSMPTV